MTIYVSGMRWRVVWNIGTKVSEENENFIFKVQFSMYT